MAKQRQRWSHEAASVVTLVALFALQVVGWAVAVPSAAAQSSEVVHLFEDGLTAYREGRYEDAEALFARAHAIEPIADLSYNRARALENLGRFDEAADAYETFLAESGDTSDRAGIEERARTLRARADEERRLADENAALREQRDALASQSAVVSPPAPPPADDDARAQWVTALFGALVAGGGGALLGLAQLDYDQARADIAQTDSIVYEARSHDEAIAGFVLIGAGSVAAIVALVWALAAPSHETRDHAAIGLDGLRLAF